MNPAQKAFNRVVLDDLIQTTVKNRMHKTYEEVLRQSNLSMYLYGDEAKKPKPTRWQSFKKRAVLYRDRVRDAWLVLIGREQIGGDW